MSAVIPASVAASSSSPYPLEQLGGWERERGEEMRRVNKTGPERDGPGEGDSCAHAQLRVIFRHLLAGLQVRPSWTQCYAHWVHLGLCTFQLWPACIMHGSCMTQLILSGERQVPGDQACMLALTWLA